MIRTSGRRTERLEKRIEERSGGSGVKIIVPLIELSKKMNAISSVVPGKTTMPILSTVLVNADKEGIHFSATDLDISVTSKINGEMEEEGNIAVPAKKLAEIVKSLSSGDVTLQATGEKLTITCGKSRFVINGRSAEDFPKIPKQKSKTSFTIDPDTLASLIQKTVYAVSTDLTRPALCGVLWEVQRTGISMVSTDGHRLAKVELNRKIGDVESIKAIIPPKALSTLKSYSESEKEIGIGIGENSVAFEMAETSIYSRLLEGPFPNYQKVIPEKNEKELVVSKDSLASATKRVSILADSLTHQVVFSAGKDKLTLHVSTQELGEANEEITANFAAEPMDIGYNASYIMDILRTIETEDISLKLDRADNAGLIEPVAPAGEIKHMCIIMPLRIS
jgi:DNA polymerase-3 subunit beta